MIKYANLIKKSAFFKRSFSFSLQIIFTIINQVMKQGSIKNLLNSVNSYYREKQMRNNPVFKQEHLKIQRKNGLTKNFMRLLNKTMIGINRIHFCRWRLFAGATGLLMGYLCSQLEDQIVWFKMNHRPIIKDAIITNLLKSKEIKDTLNHNLLENVYKNKDVQYNLHQLLYWKAIKPFEGKLASLSADAIVKATSDHNIHEQLTNLTKNQIDANRKKIKNKLFEVLDKQNNQLLENTKKGISSYFKSEQFYRLLANQTTEAVCSILKSNQTRQKLYVVLRENFLSW